MVKAFLYISASKYLNVIIEYLVVIITSQMLSLEDRAEFLMITSSAIFLATLSGLSFDQYGAKDYHKYDNFNPYKYFKFTVVIGIAISAFSFLYFSYYINVSFFHYFLVFILTIGILISKQYIVLYQINDIIIKYSKLLILNKLILISVMVVGALLSPALNIFLIIYVFSYMVGLIIFYLGCKTYRYTGKVERIESNITSFNKNKLLYFTTIITSLFYYLNNVFIYKYLDKVSLSYFHIAIQYNLAFVVLAQSFNIYVLSDKSRLSASYFLKSLGKIYIFILIVFVINLILVYSSFFPSLIGHVFGEKYIDAVDVFKSIIWILPSMLISMFFVSLWVVSNKYKLLFKINLIGLLLFMLSALFFLRFYERSIYSIIYALYISSLYGFFANHYLIYFYKVRD